MTESGTQNRKSTSRRERQRRQAIENATLSMSTGTTVGAGFKPLRDADALRIHRAALDLLAEVGMARATPRVIETALAAGCSLSGDGRLLFPRSLVEDLLDGAAREFPVYARDSKFDFEAKSGGLNFCTGGAAVKMLDIESRQYRPSLLRDLYDLARLCDTLENIQWFARPIVVTDIEDVFEFDLNTIYAAAAGTKKHIATSISHGGHLPRLLPILDLLAGGDFARRPFCTVHATTVVSPLNFAEESLDVACDAVDIGMPIHCQTGPQAGATAPAALAGTLVQGCAESLASLCVVNMLKPGHAVVLGHWAFVSDLRTGAFSGGGGEQALLGAASGQMSAFYGIPGGMGAGMTDSKLPDNQAGFEKGISIALAALSGGGFVYESAGMLASLLGCSLEAMVIDDDMLSSVRRVARGIEVDDNSLSLDVIKQVVSGPGHFLGAEQTLERMKSEFVYPRYADRRSPDDWFADGATDIWQRARDRARQVLREHYPQYIPDEVDRLIRERFPIRLEPCWLESGKT